MDSQDNKIQWISAQQNDGIDLTVITVTWNSVAQLQSLGDSLQKSEGALKAEWYIVDNASSDDSVALVRRLFPWAHIITNSENAGFAKANNQAREKAQGRHLLLLNPDTTVETDALEKVVKILDGDKTIGVLGGMLVMQNGQPVPQLRRFPTLLSQLCVLLKIAAIFPFTISRYMGKDLDLAKTQDCDSIRGAFFAISETAKKTLGMLDERYFLWFEEVDYCRSAKEHGLRVVYDPSIKAYDFLTSPSFAQRDSLWKNKVFSASMIAYFDKWHPAWQVSFIKNAARLSFVITKMFSATKR